MKGPFTVVLTDADKQTVVPVECRLRRFLKGALRAYGLKCVSVKAEDASATEAVEADGKQTVEASA